jgi:hypothetical protein
VQRIAQAELVAYCRLREPIVVNPRRLGRAASCLSMNRSRLRWFHAGLPVSCGRTVCAHRQGGMESSALPGVARDEQHQHANHSGCAVPSPRTVSRSKHPIHQGASVLVNAAQAIAKERAAAKGVRQARTMDIGRTGGLQAKPSRRNRACGRRAGRRSKAEEAHRRGARPHFRPLRTTSDQPLSTSRSRWSAFPSIAGWKHRSRCGRKATRPLTSARSPGCFPEDDGPWHVCRATSCPKRT